MPHYTLYYFNGRGRAEICRMMFAVAGIAYDDRRLEFDDWEAYKNGFPGWCVPALEMEDGYMMSETMAICRYLAREYDFYGGAHLEMMRCDYISDCLYEIMDDYMRYFHWQNGRFRNNTAGSEMMSKDIECSDMRYPAYDHYMYWRYMNTCNRILPFLERTLQMCNNGSQYFMGEQMMWCDMMFYCCLETPFMDDPALFDNYPMLRGLWSRVGHHPRIFNYLTRRPYCDW